MSGNKIEIQRHFPPCQEWVYYKIYSGPKTLDLILVHEFEPVLKMFLKEKLIKKFFFIRYKDPDDHIRIRLHIYNQNCVNRITKSMNEILLPYRKNRIVRKIVLDTYSREIERYGKHTIQFVEDLFHIDSSFILQCLKSNNSLDKWLHSITICNLMFDIFGLNINQKFNFCHSMFKGYSKEFNYSKGMKIEMDGKYRNHSQKIMDSLEYQTGGIFKSELIYQYKTSAYPVVYKILGIYRFENIDRKFDLISSLLHMHLNRMFKNQQRMQEFVIYYFLSKAYTSIKAREEKIKV